MIQGLANDPGERSSRGLRRRGINYDVGTYTRGANQPSSRELFDPEIVRKEMEIIQSELHCTSIRISGRDVDRLVAASECALHQGLEVWFSPALIDEDEEAMLDYYRECALAAEALRRIGPDVVFVAGCELSLFMKGILDGATTFDRIGVLMNPWRLLKYTIRKGSFHKRLNAFLSKAVNVIREHFHGQITYASGTWENVNWSLFDIVSADHYRDAHNHKRYREQLRAYFKHGKPVVITEFGCSTYEGAQDRGGYGWNVVDHRQSPKRLEDTIIRDEQVQVRYMRELWDIFQEEGVDGAFWFTFVMPSYPYDEERLFNLDTASYSVVRTLKHGQTGTAYPGMPWDTKASFAALSGLYKQP
ncbi:abortive infection protein [Paenibacillus sp. XY044]|uniref:abortive infection protein n=1 Tax=Paenibacillus sp. XY044 TaxID=2026089 RepID=UPI000B991697|nr:abortive infection protein [Paenibacillus sp. XY044]OZB96698.1 abortive infection protein [Paenibacillus sp. XY044]